MTHTYTYFVKPWVLFLVSAAALFPASFLMVCGLFLNGPLPLTLIYFGLSMLSFLGFLLSLLAGLRIKRNRPKIVLSEDGMTVPFRAWSSQIVSMAYSEIESIEMIAIAGERTLHVEYNGRSLDLQERFMESPSALSELWSAIDFLRNGDGGSVTMGRRRVPCLICQSPVQVADAEARDGKCQDCFALNPNDFRWAGLRLIGVGLAVVMFGVVVSVVVWQAGGVIVVAAGMVVPGIIMIISGLYGLITGNPIRYWHG